MITQKVPHGIRTGYAATRSIFEAPLNTWTPGEILAYYQTRTSVQYFPVPDEEQTTREKIDGILVNRFDFNDETYHLPAGFDWTLNPSQDKEWIILLHKFYYAVGLGAFYHETGDRRYLDKWLELTDRWIDTVPLDFLSTDVMGRRIQNWIFAHFYFVTHADAPDIPAMFYVKFLESLYHQVNYLRDNLTPARNHRTIELYAIFLAAVVFPEMKGADEWLEFSRRELFKNIQTDLLADGVQYELSTDYHCLVLKNYLGIRRLALLNRIPMPAEMDARLQKALDFAMYAHKPDGLIPALSDGDSRSFLNLLEQGYALYGNEEWLYVATQGVRGKPPAQPSKAFPKSGYYILRSGWGNGPEPYTDERYLIFDCGPLGVGNHGHLDLLSFEMAAYGQSLIVDPGRYIYDEAGETNWRALFRGTGYHNTVQVDKKNQTCYQFHKTRYRIRGPEPDSELKAFISRDSFDFLHGVARSHEYAAVHERKIFFLRPEYWIISDFLLADETHTYDLRFHLSDQAFKKVRVTLEHGTYLVNAPHLVLAQPFALQVQLWVEQGYVSRTYGVKQPATIVKFTCQAANATFHTVLLPYKSERPEISVTKLPALSGSQVCSPAQAFALCITINKHGQKFRDYYFSADPGLDRQYSFGNFIYDGALLFVRQDADGNIVRLHGQADATLIAGGHPIPIVRDES